MIRKKYQYSPGWANWDVLNGREGDFNLYYLVRQEMMAYQLHCLWGWTGGMGDGWYYRLRPANTPEAITYNPYPKALYTNIKPII